MPAATTVEESIRALIARHDDERRQIARDLHDVVGQALTGIRLHLELIRREPDRIASVAFEAEEATRLVDTTLRQVRDLAFEIRPAALDDLGLEAAARSWVVHQARISGFVADFNAEMPTEEPPPDITAACFRALQEAVTNVSRHASASCVEVSLAAIDDELALTVRDDGVGFELDGTHRRNGRALGLLGARERIALVGGRMTIDSVVAEGTTFQAWFPWVRRHAVRRARVVG
jgi:signal transduction histidine kinase